ncbi:LytR family transcriptional attenuator [Lentzea atacamensis]|uniref:LytR family transcriptional attenuator n=1 Tax=Lentzea atacamensis TaxID=531938 RepID=A0A316IB57_9PSEU|nr:LytR family transcriptional attenuator [Lentzea atacamensis]RAS60636.1 LytR family transcriptional attenuator [Lentzea atacamensis]
MQIGVALVAFFVLVAVGFMWSVQNSLTSSVRTLPMDALDNLPSRPPQQIETATGRAPATLLLLGSDRRNGIDVGGGVTGQRADAIMLVRFSADRRRIDVLSIPRDAWVDIPGRGVGKINASFNEGAGPAVQTVEALTGIRVDHVIVIDFTGVRQLTTALGGVTVINEHGGVDPLTGMHFAAGPIVLSGDRALTFLRWRYNLPGGDFGRMAHHQALVGAVAVQLRRSIVVTNPVVLHDMVKIIGSHLTVDAQLTREKMSELMTDVLTVPKEGVRFYIAPSVGFGRGPVGESYVELDHAALRAACAAIRDDQPVSLPPTPITLP